MRKRLLLLTLLMAMFAPWAANAQTVTIGTGTSAQNSAPIANYYDLSMAEMIFTADEIGTIDVNTILSLGFQCTTNVSKNYGVTVYMKNIEADAFTATSDFITLSADDVVFTGTVSPTEGWTTIDLPTPFTYNRTGNLLIAVNKTSGGYDGNTAIWKYTSTSTTSTYMMLYSQKDGTSVYDPTTTLSLSLNYNRPNVQLVFGTPPSTPKPTGLTVSGITHNEATLSWTENGTATSWQYCLNGDEDHPVTMNTNPYTLTGLTTLTSYTVKVRSVGNNEYSDWSNEVSFSTTAQATAVGDGWSDDFEGTTCGWELINGTLTNKWCWGTAANNGGTHGLYVSNDNGTTNAYTNNSTAMVFATKFLNFAEGKFEFSYDWICNGESTYDYLRVALVPASVTLTAGTTPSSFSYYGLPTGWIALDGGGKLNLSTSWENKSVAINVPAGNYYLVMAWKDDTSGGSNPPAAVDNVSITKIACDYDVEDLAVSNITTTTADVTWTDSEVGEWQVALKEGDGEWATLPNTYTTNSAMLTGLTTATNYQVKVRAYCNATDQGSWCEAISFASACEAFDLESDDFTENFDDMTAPSIYTPTEHTMPVCWNVINTCTYSSYMYYPTVSSYGSNSTSGSNYLRFYSYYSSWSDYDPQDQYAILPVMENLDGKQIKLSVKGGSTNSTFYVGLMTNPTDPSTFVAFATQAPTTSYVEYEFPISGTGNYIAIKMNAATSTETSHSLYIDDIIVEDAPTCLKPTDLVVTGTTTTTATLSWTNGAPTQTAWQICLNGDEANPIMANSNPFTIDEEGVLAPSTTYTAKVRAYCNADDQSEWSDEVSFATACEAITIDETHTYSEGFEGYTGVSYSATNGVMPVCWDSYSTGSVAPHIIGSGSYYYHHDGTNALTFYGSGYCYAAMPEFTNALSELEIKFWMQTESASNGSLVLGYITAEDENYNTFTAIETYANNNNSMVQRTTDLDEVPATATRLVFRWYYSSQYSCCIDDVEVTLIPTCLAPSVLEVTSTTTTTAILSWTVGGSETAWQICLNGDETNPIMANSNPFTVEGLTAATAYTAKVRAYCSADDQSDWSNEVSFTTNCEVIVVDATHPFTEGFESTTFAPICWDNIPSGTRQWSRNTSTSNIHTGSGSAYSGYYGDIYLVMPDLQLGTDGDAAQLSFWSYNTYVSDYDKNSVVLLDGENEIELWSPESVVNRWEETTIDLSTYMGQTISLAFKYEGDNAHGWYVDDVRVAMVKTFTKTIAAVGEENWAEGKGGYYLIASPLADAVDPTTITDMTTGDYDLYSFNQGLDLEWQNYKASAFNLVNGKGYLYASKNGITLTFTGVPGTNGEVTLSKTGDENVDFQGWNLVGNPFGEDAYINKPCYTLENSDTYIENTAGTPIHAMQGLLVVADNDGETLTFNTEAPAGKTAKLNMNLRSNNKQLDNAILVFGDNQRLGKMSFRENSSKIYMPVEGKDYAIATAESNVGEMPVSFKAENNGSYTLSFNAEEVNFAYLHLIDNMTGIETDLLSNPSYSFEARTTDYANRFKLVFATGNADDTFAFFSNGSFVINNEGNATLQVIDVTGRILNSETINGCANVNVNAAPGVYMLRLVNGDNVKVQKVVVR